MARQLEYTSLVIQDYFPRDNVGQARIETRPQTTPWGTREFRVIDPDEHILTVCEEHGVR